MSCALPPTTGGPEDHLNQPAASTDATCPSNGEATTAPQAQTAPDHANGAPTERGEAVAARIAAGVTGFASVIGQGAMWLASRAGEEARDFWAEAQAIRRGNKS